MSRLEDISKEFRDKLLVKNIYGNNDGYTSSHANALSDGDEHGKGEKSGSIGGATDIKTRTSLLAKNKYSSNNDYNSSNA